jgi:peptide/nickel transport system permease protein
LSYFARRTGTFFLTLLLVSVLAFLAFNAIPGDPVSLMLGTEATPERVAALKAALGLDRPLPERYLEWLGGFVRGDPGDSIKYSRPISLLIAERLPPTLTLAGLAIAMIAAVSLPLGLYCAARRGSLVDRAVGSLAMLGLSLPSFFLGVLVIWALGLVLRLFAPGGYVDYRAAFWPFVGYLVYPAAAIAIPNSAVVVKFLRASAIRELGREYVRTARGKGLEERAVLFRHVLKNAIVPVVSLAGMILAEVVSGSIVIEQVFSVPGIGRLLLASITSRDFPLAETLVVYIASAVVVANFLADLAIQVIDPRIEVS